MSRDEVQKLLGGYATGTLTPEERAALFEAALDDQDLFDQLAREQPLADLFADSTARAQLLAALEERPQPWYKRWASWGVPALATALIVAGVAVWRVSQNAARPVEVAKVEAPVAATAPRSEPVDTPLPTNAAPKPHMPAPPVAARRQAQAENVPVDALKNEVKKEADAAPAQAAGSLGQPAAAPVPAPPLPQASSGARAMMGASGGVIGGVPPASVAGTVKDASGAAIANADIKFTPAGAATPAVATQSAANGNFAAPLLAGDYHVEVNAPGFQAFRRDDVVIDGASQTQLPVTLQVGAATEAVQVTAAAPRPQQLQQSAGQQSGQLDQLSKAKVGGAFMADLRTPPLASRVLRKNADGSNTPVTADDLHAGETVVIEITPGTAGYLTVTETAATSIVNAAPVQAGKAFDTPAIVLDKAGLRNFQAVVSAAAPGGGGGGGGSAVAGGRGGSAKRAVAAPASAATPPQSTVIRLVVH